MIAEQKQLVREEMRSLAHSYQKEKKISFCTTQIPALPQWREAASVLLYAPLLGEPDLLGLLDAFPKKRFCFPRIEKKELRLYQWVAGARWITHRYGLQEPDPQEWYEVSPEAVDLALIPGLAFDHEGGRLGRGGGFYDRLLGDRRWRGLKVGVAWPWQMVPKVPKETHDVLMDLVIALQ